MLEVSMNLNNTKSLKMYMVIFTWHHQIRETVSPQQEYDMQPDNETVIPAAQEHKQKKTAPKGV
jgi:hypothetical protein